MNTAQTQVNLSKYRSVVQTMEKPTLSDKYTFIPTMRVIDVLGDMGWYPAKVSEGSAKMGNIGFQRHMVRFRQGNAQSIVLKDTVFPEIVVTNSHNGSSSFNIFSGLFRLVCLNGMVVGNANFGEHRVKHLGYADEQIREIVDMTSSHLTRVSERVNDFRQIELTNDERIVFAEAALEVKYGEESTERGFIPSALIQPIRREDATPTLWSAYNTVQEKLVKGGRFEQVRGTRGLRKSVRVTSVGEDIRINRGLWMLTEKMAEIKTRRLDA